MAMGMLTYLTFEQIPSSAKITKHGLFEGPKMDVETGSFQLSLAIWQNSNSIFILDKLYSDHRPVYSRYANFPQTIPLSRQEL